MNACVAPTQMMHQHVVACAEAAICKYYNAVVLDHCPMPNACGPAEPLPFGRLPALQQAQLVQLSALPEPFDCNGAAAVLAVDPDAAEDVLKSLQSVGALVVKPESRIEPWALSGEVRSSIYARRELGVAFHGAQQLALAYVQEVVNRATSMFAMLPHDDATKCYDSVLAKYAPDRLQLQVDDVDDDMDADDDAVSTTSSPCDPLWCFEHSDCV